MSSCGRERGTGQRTELRIDPVAISQLFTVPSALESGVGREKEVQRPRSAVDDDGAFALQGSKRATEAGHDVPEMRVTWRFPTFLIATLIVGGLPFLLEVEKLASAHGPLFSSGGKARCPFSPAPPA